MIDSATSLAVPHSRRGVATRVAYWALQFAGWTLYFWSQASGEVIFADVPWSKSATLWGGICVSGLALTHLLRCIIKREQWLSLPPRALLIRMLLATALLASTLFVINIVLSLMEYGHTRGADTRGFLSKAFARRPALQSIRQFAAHHLDLDRTVSGLCRSTSSLRSPSCIRRSLRNCCTRRSCVCSKHSSIRTSFSMRSMAFAR